MRFVAALAPARLVLLATALAAPGLAAQAGVVGRVKQPDLEITIYDTQDWCPAGALSATWVQPQLQVKGCYVEHEGMLFIAWEDGDRHMVKRAVFTGRTI